MITSGTIGERQALHLSAKAAALAALLTAAMAAGCSEPAKGPADQAAFTDRTRCGPEVTDSAIAPILDGKAVQQVEPLYSTFDTDKSGETSKLRGAKITINALPGITAEWLDRELECHNARITLGQAQPTPDDPFWLSGATLDIDVRPAKDGFIIGVAAFSSADAKQILDRAQSFAKAKAGPASP
ncbi:MAG: hypothetical protein ABSF69_22775 [Polyangiaceae bacterium]|jgi:hypothetical protein